MEKLKLSNKMIEIPIVPKLPKYPEGSRVWLVENAQDGHEPPTGTVVLAGNPWYVVRLDVEFRMLHNPDGYIDVREQNLEKL